MQTRQGGLADAARTAREAQAAAHKAHQPRLEALALLRLSEALWRAEDAAAGLAAAEQATERFERLGDAMWQGRALWSQACALAALGRSIERERAARQALALAQQTGDRFGLGCAHNMLDRESRDLAQQLKGLQQALAAFEAGGYAERQLGIRHNLAIAYYDLGLYRRARRIAQAVVAVEAGRSDPFARTLTLGLLAWIELALQRPDAAHALSALVRAANERIGSHSIAGWGSLLNARLALAEGRSALARRHAKATIEVVQGDTETTLRVLGLSAIARAWLQSGQVRRAQATSARAIAT